VPPERSAVYRVAATTGLRRSEIGSLVWRDVDLKNGFITIQASSAKNRKTAILPIPEGTVEALAALKGGAFESDSVFKTLPNMRTFYKDLKRSGLQKTKKFEGIDFHALRATFATSLARAGVMLTQAQRLMRCER
jgi:integrase